MILIGLQLLHQVATEKPAAPARATKSVTIWVRRRCRSTSSCLTFLCAHKGTGALLGLHDAADLEFAVSPHHGVRVDRQIYRHLAYGGQLVASGQGSGSEPAST